MSELEDGRVPSGREDVVECEGNLHLLAGYPAPLKIGTQMFAQATLTKLIGKVTQQGQSLDAAMSWAESEIEGFMRT